MVFSFVKSNQYKMQLLYDDSDKIVFSFVKSNQYKMQLLHYNSNKIDKLYI